MEVSGIKKTKHKLMAVIKFDFEAWLLTEHGLKCNDITTLRGQPYLRNRLYWAFEGGVNSCEADKRLQNTIDWYEQKLRELKKENKELKTKLKNQSHEESGN